MINNFLQTVILNVVAYYRMSSDEQSASIAQQQKEVRAYAAARGWKIIREYIDEGKSGSKNTSQRLSFHKMIADAAAGDFSAVLVWDSSRFGRLDTIAGAPFKDKLRIAGVHLETTKGERIDWGTSMGRMMDALQSESNSEYSKNLAANVVRGRLDALNSGYWPHSAIPFGYDRQLVEGDTVKMVVPRVENFRKPHNWKLKLVPNEKEAEIIRRMFTTFDERDISIRAICVLFKDELGPSGTGWPYNTFVSTLTNPVYAGDIAFGLRQKSMRGAFKQAPQQIKKDGCIPLIPREVWERVQQKLKDRKSGKQQRRRKDKRAYALSGLIVCGHCGHFMSGYSDGVRQYYTCLSPGNRPHLGCKCWRVREDKILPAVCRAVSEAIDFELLRAVQANPKPAEQVEVKQLREGISALKRKISRGSDNLLEASPELFGAMQKTLLKWKDELAKAENTLSLALAKTNKSEIERWNEWWQGAKSKIVNCCPIVWGNRHWQARPLAGAGSLLKRIGTKIGCVEIDGKVYEVSADGHVSELVEVEGPIRDAVDAEADTLRDLLRRLNLSVVLNFQPNGKRYYQLTRADLKAEFGEATLTELLPNRDRVTCQHTNTSATPAAMRSRSFNRSWRGRLRSVRCAGRTRCGG